MLRSHTTQGLNLLYTQIYDATFSILTRPYHFRTPAIKRGTNQPLSTLNFIGVTWYEPVPNATETNLAGQTIPFEMTVLSLPLHGKKD